MRVTALVVASVLSLSASAFAQDWSEYINKDDGFRVDFPGPPTVMATTFKSEYGVDLPARVYRVVRGLERYSITVADYTQIQRLADEKAKTTCPKDFPDERACGLVNCVLEPARRVSRRVPRSAGPHRTGGRRWCRTSRCAAGGGPVGLAARRARSPHPPHAGVVSVRFGQPKWTSWITTRWRCWEDKSCA